MQDRIIDIDIESSCEILDTTIEDNSYEGQHLSAEYDADEDATYISGDTYRCKDAFRALSRCRWNSSAKAWVCDGNQVAAVRAADHHWDGGRTTLARRIASWLRTPEYLRHPSAVAVEKAGRCGDRMDARIYVDVMTGRCEVAEVAEVTEAATCAAIELTAEVEAEPAARRIAVSLRAVVVAAAKGAAHAVRSARARKGWETRRRNAARAAEILDATCEPLVVDADALPPSVSYSATPGSECCHGRTAHGTDGRVVTDYPSRPFAAPAADCCGTGRLPARKPHADYRWSTESELEAVRDWYRTQACKFPDFRRQPDGTYRYNEKCIGPREGRAARRRARDAAWHREHRRLARERAAAMEDDDHDTRP